MSNDEKSSSLRRRGVSEAESDGVKDAPSQSPEGRAAGEAKLDEVPDTGVKLQAKASRLLHLQSDSYWLTRIVIIRYLAFVYFVAFLVAANQNSALLGENGLLPTTNYLRRISNIANDDLTEMLQKTPTLLWFLDWKQNATKYLDLLAYSGLALSGIVFLTGCANSVMMFLLWAIYHSIVNIGQRWYSFGWESQILETGFLAIFLCPVLSLRQVPRSTPPSIVVIWAYRWLIFRIMIGAGMIKIRGDKCWRDLTCMNYHYETQPVPNPMAYFLHQSPEVMHKFEVLSNHFIELVAPFFLLPFLPRRFRLVGGFIQVFFQVVLIISGNLSFLNWLTIVPAIACFDDKSLAWLFSSKHGRAKWQVWDMQQGAQGGRRPMISLGCRIRMVMNVSLGVLIAFLSIPIVQNLLSHRQIMNTSFDPLRLVNTYGAFGSITKERTEVILQGSYGGPNSPWLEYEFKCKPGNVTRRPCVISPYHYRLDWLMWFAAFGNYEQHPWLVHLAAKLLVNDPLAESLIEKNPFHGRDPPKLIRAEHYRYTFTKIGSSDAKKGKWWKRRHLGNYMPPISLDTVKDYLKAMRWELPPKPTIKRKKKAQ